MIELQTDIPAVNLARETIYRFVAAGMRHPAEQLLPMRDAASIDLLREAIGLLRDEAAEVDVHRGFGEEPADAMDATELIAWLTGPADDLFAEYDRVFGIGPTADFPPYETEFCANQEPFYRAQQMADVAGFYKAFGLNVARGRPDRPDHLALELEFMALLLTNERLALESISDFRDEHVAVCRATQRSFFNDHVSWWVPSFAAGLRRKADTGPYAALGYLLAAFMPLERARLGVKAPQMPVRPRSVEPPEAQSGCEGCTPTT
ncbi:MAG: molecular chaperone TorD family protein [Gemmataceae bacterium]|nr:molecular chaperone TorD family protein [Gemmataceae bacterium]